MVDGLKSSADGDKLSSLPSCFYSCPVKKSEHYVLRRALLLLSYQTVFSEYLNKLGMSSRDYGTAIN